MKNDYVAVEIINKLNGGIEGTLEKEGRRGTTKQFLFRCNDFDLRKKKNYKEAMHTLKAKLGLELI